MGRMRGSQKLGKKAGDQLEGAEKSAGLALAGGRAESACCWMDPGKEADEGETEAECHVSGLNSRAGCFVNRTSNPLRVVLLVVDSNCFYFGY